jgi:GNAT superfamily N-acetyltransferase
MLARAFDDDPVMAYMLPDPASRAARLPRVFRTLARHQHLPEAGGIELARDGDRIVGAAMWDPPGRWRQGRIRELMMLPGLFRAFGSGMSRGGAVADTMRAKHPEEPHWYLAVLRTDPSARGAGHGRALLDSRLDKCDAEHCPAYLESSKASNVPYYERFGFTVREEITIPRGPTLWAMWRDPR